MPTNAATGAVVPVGSDPYALTADLKKLAESQRTVIAVSTKTQRDGLAALFPGGTLPQGTTVCRLDMGGALEKWTGTDWKTDVRVEVKGAATINAPLLKTGIVTASTDANGTAALVFDTPFPNRFLGGLVAQARITNIGMILFQVDEALSNTQRLAVYVYNTSGAILPNLISFRASYVAWGD